MATIETPIIGLIPAAGLGSRLGLIPCSKELLPLGFARRPDGRIRPKAVCEYLLEQMRRAGCQRVYFVLRRGKWDIPAFFGSGSEFGLHLGYLLADEPWGPPFTLGQAAPFVDDAIVVTGFPDILLSPQDMMADVVEALLDAADADLMLGTLPSDDPGADDLVRLADGDRVALLAPKEETPDWQEGDCTWAIAAWRPPFTRLLVSELANLREQAVRHAGPGQPEWPVGTVIKAAISRGHDVRARHFANALHLDVGLPERLVRARSFPGVWDGS